MNGCKVSVILPVHNSLPYLQQCLESAINQTLHDIEIICVCGSGNDGSDLMVESYQKKDSRIIKIDDENGSYGHKLNIGTLASNGEYIAILETDDFLQEDMFEILYNTAVSEHVDYVDADYYEFFEMNNCEYNIIHKKYMDESVYNRKLVDKEAKMSAILSDITANWTALYKKEFLVKNALFYNESPGASYQDLGFRYLLACLAESTFHVEKPLYNYRTDNVNSSVKDMNKIFAVQGEYLFVYEQMKKRDIQERYLWDYYYVWKYRDYFWNAQRLAEEGRKAFIEVYVSELAQDTKDGKIRDEIVSDRYINCLKKPLDETEDFIELLNQAIVTTAQRIDVLMRIIDSCSGKNIVICGCGIRGKTVNNLLINEHVLCMCDANQELWGQNIEGRIVMSYIEASHRFPDAIYIVANKLHGNEIACELNQLGIKKENMILYD